jgi:hypothetical protein
MPIITPKTPRNGGRNKKGFFGSKKKQTPRGKRNPQKTGRKR